MRTRRILQGRDPFRRFFHHHGGASEKPVPPSDQYLSLIHISYENATGTAKELYGKYKDKIKVNRTRQNASYCSGDEIYINYDKNMADPRGPESIYYHESGHWIVHENGWISDEKMSPEFQKFDQAVKEDVSRYISQIEMEQRVKYSQYYSGDQLEAVVTKRTRELLKTELGLENYHVLDGVSDMVEASSGGKYWATYGHGEDYWERNPTRQANEALDVYKRQTQSMRFSLFLSFFTSDSRYEYSTHFFCCLHWNKVTSRIMANSTSATEDA